MAVTPTLREQIAAVDRAIARQRRWLDASDPAALDAVKVRDGMRALIAARDTLALVASLRLTQDGAVVAEAFDVLTHLGADRSADPDAPAR